MFVIFDILLRKRVSNSCPPVHVSRCRRNVKIEMESEATFLGKKKVAQTLDFNGQNTISARGH